MILLLYTMMDTYPVLEYVLSEFTQLIKIRFHGMAQNLHLNRSVICRICVSVKRCAPSSGIIYLVKFFKLNFA